MIDVRAEVVCSLGPVISASVSDDYLQGSGIIKTRGSVELKGAFVPAVGTTVNFSFNKPSGTLDLPRELRVLSSTVDPFRQITKVELGCALTYFANRKPATENPNSKEENEVPCYVYNYATLPISAAYVLEQCATKLGLTLSSNPLTSKFSIDEFDLSPGYVQVMGDLLVSEGYFGIVRSGTLLEVFSLQDAGMSGPVITAEDIIDLGPVGVGTLPGETARVKYTTRRLKLPDSADQNTALKRMWEREEVIGDVTPTSYTYTNEDGESVTVERRYVPYQLSLSVYDKWDRLVWTTTHEYTVSTEINGRWSGDAQKMTGCERINYQRNYYKVAAPPGPLDNINPVQYPLFYLDYLVKSQLDADTGPAAECIAAQRPEDYSDVLRTVSETWVSEMEVGGMIYVDGFKAADGTVIGLSGTPGYLSSRSIVTYDKDKDSGITKTHTEQYAIRALTAPGQQDIAVRSQNEYDTSTGTTLADTFAPLRTAAVGLRFVNGETRIRTEREYGLQKRPSQSERNNTGNAKNDPAEAVEETVWAVGSVETEATQEFTLPYAPDDVIGWTELGGYTSTPSDAAEKARNFGRIQNRLLLGNRAALALQLDPALLPDQPFAPIYVQAAGITGQYRVNACSWAMTGDGVIASTDALYWGAVGADVGTTTSWVPLPPGMDAGDLPETPETPEVVIPPFNETVVKAMSVRSTVAVQRFGYALELLTLAPVTTKARLTATKIKKIEVPSAGTFTIAAPLPRVAISANVRIGLTNVTLQAFAPAVVIDTVVLVPSAAFTFDALVPQSVGRLATKVYVPTANIALGTLVPKIATRTSLLLHFDGTNASTTFTDSSRYSLTVTANGNAQISTAQSKFGGASGLFDGNNDYLTVSSSGLAFGTGDFTVEGWIRRAGATANGANSSSTLFDARTAEPSVQPFLFVDGDAAGNLLTFYVNGSARITGTAIAVNTWYFVQLIRSSGTTRLYIDGSQVGSNYTDSNNYTNQNWTIAGRFAAVSSDYRAFNGYLDDWRVTKSLAITPGVPTEAFPDS